MTALAPVGPSIDTCRHRPRESMTQGLVSTRGILRSYIGVLHNTSKAGSYKLLAYYIVPDTLSNL